MKTYMKVKTLKKDEIAALKCVSPSLIVRCNDKLHRRFTGPPAKHPDKVKTLAIFGMIYRAVVQWDKLLHILPFFCLFFFSKIKSPKKYIVIIWEMK